MHQLICESRLPNAVNTEAIKTEYKNGKLTVGLPKRAESKPKQVKVNLINGKNEAKNGAG